MPEKREGFRQINLMVREHVADSFDELCETTGRSKNEEGEHALERHVAQPPMVRVAKRVKAPELSPAEIQERPERRPRRRKQK